jgi:hypothetical protein
LIVYSLAVAFGVDGFCCHAWFRGEQKKPQRQINLLEGGSTQSFFLKSHCTNLGIIPPYLLVLEIIIQRGEKNVDHQWNTGGAV